MFDEAAVPIKRRCNVNVLLFIAVTFINSVPLPRLIMSPTLNAAPEVTSRSVSFVSSCSDVFAPESVLLLLKSCTIQVSDLLAMLVLRFAGTVMLMLNHF